IVLAAGNNERLAKRSYRDDSTVFRNSKVVPVECVLGAVAASRVTGSAPLTLTLRTTMSIQWEFALRRGCRWIGYVRLWRFRELDGERREEDIVARRVAKRLRHHLHLADTAPWLRHRSDIEHVPGEIEVSVDVRSTYAVFRPCIVEYFARRAE